jgi:hypothetical protein
VINGREGHDGPVALGRIARTDEMSMTVGISGVIGNFRIVVSSKIVCQLMTKTVISQGAGFGDDGEGVSSIERSKCSHSATVETSSKQSSGIRTVSQGCGVPLHAGEVGHEGGGVIGVIDGGRLYTEPGHRHGDQTVGVTLVGLSYNLVDVTGDV